MNFFEEMQWRGLVQQATEGLDEMLRGEKVVAYIGFDPSGPSLHVGSLLQIMTLARFQRCGHTPVAIAGGGTGLIGDPSGKSAERPLLTAEKVAENLESIKIELSRFLDFGQGASDARMVNNLDWLGQLELVEFLRDYGKHFSISALLARESVKRRLEEQDGMSFTEFTYSLLQAYDYLELFDRYGCRLQMGGSDQWGNIAAGISLIRRLRGAKVHGLVSPLVTTSAGTKFGKTEAGAVWLDPERTSPYQFYQFWLNTDDADVVSYLKFFTWLDRQEIGELETLLETEPGGRAAQRALAREVTRIVHGEAGVEAAERVSKLFFFGDVAGLRAAEILDALQDAPASDIARERVDAGLSVVELLAETGVASSKGEARRLLEGGGIYLNGGRVEDATRSVTLSDSIDGELFVVRKGKKKYCLVRIR